MVNVDLSDDGLAAFDFDPRGARFPYSSRLSWPMPVAQNTSHNSPPIANMKRSTTPLQRGGHGFQRTVNHQAQSLIPDWPISQASAADLDYSLDTARFPSHFSEDYPAVPFQTSPTDFLSSQTHIDTSLIDTSYLPISNNLEAMHCNWPDSLNDLMGYTTTQHGLPDMNVPHQNLAPNSPQDAYCEVRSLTSSSSDNGWTSIDYTRQAMDSSFRDLQVGAIFNPGTTLHNRTFSDSSYSDLEQQSRHSDWSSYVEVPNAINSPGTESIGEVDFYHDHSHHHKDERQRPGPIDTTVTSALVKPIAIKKSLSPQTSPVSTGRSSPPSRRQSRKNNNTKTGKPMIRRSSQTISRTESERRVGRRKGPLRPEQRKQASEIRKMGACLRCRFLKKVCDKGEPCGGCQPSHARLWQVPCTRIDIKEIGFFMKGWKADYERHVTLGFSIGNIKGFAETERTLFITHGYGHMLPVRAREVFVRDESVFGLDWVENVKESPEEHTVDTARLSAGMEGISIALLSDYLDRHIDGGFEGFIDEYFEGTPFISQMLKTAYRFWLREKTPVIRKALKLVLAYNLTQHVTMVEGIPDEERFLGKINDDNSKFSGKTVAPVMINFQIKCAMADMWRELQKDILEELSSLYSSVYTKDKLKHWPTIFMVACILLAVWEEMQFDCHYRVPDPTAVNKFCNDMETTPVGVIVGLFSAISQKLPSFGEWDSHKHHNLLNSNQNVCYAMEEVRDHVAQHETYLRTRSRAVFDRENFDSLSNKFVSKLVIRAN